MIALVAVIAIPMIFSSAAASRQSKHSSCAIMERT